MKIANKSFKGRKLISLALTAVFIFSSAASVLLTSCKKDDGKKIRPADYGSYGSDLARKIAADHPDRKPYSEGEKATGEFIKEEMTKLKFEPQVQTFTTKNGTSANYVVKIPGTGFYDEDSEGKVVTKHRIAIIGAHYDNLPPETKKVENTKTTSKKGAETTALEYSFDGISDNASGTACLLTAMKAFSEYPPFAYDVYFVAFGAGNDDYAGAREFYNSLTDEEKLRIDVMYCMESLYAGDKLYASSGYKSLNPQNRYKMRRKLYQAYDVCFANTLFTNYGFDLYYNESGVKTDLNGDGTEDIYNEVSANKSDYLVFDEAGIPVVFFDSFEYNFTKMDEMKETKNLNLQNYGGMIRRTHDDSTAFLDSVLMEPDYDRDGDGEIDCSGDRLQIRINAVAFIIVEALLKGSDYGMTKVQYDEYLEKKAKESALATAVTATGSDISASAARKPASETTTETSEATTEETTSASATTTKKAAATTKKKTAATTKKKAAATTKKKK